jgi:casein kinase II subunit beta
LHKYESMEFGTCPNHACQNFPVLPVGLSNDLKVESVKVFCPCCEQVYASHQHGHVSSLDGAFFGTTFPHLLLLLRESLSPQ